MIERFNLLLEQSGIFLDNDEYKKYLDLLNSATIYECNLDYFERHHIIPRSCGGGDDENNLIKLTYSDHYRAHMLLCQCVKPEFQLKMVYAALFFSNKNGLFISAEDSEKLKIRLKETRLESGYINPFKREKVRAMSSARAKHRNKFNNPMKNPEFAKKHNDKLRKPNLKIRSTYEAVHVETGISTKFESMQEIKDFFKLKENSSIIRAYQKNRVIASGPMAGYTIHRLHSAQIDGPKK